MRRELPHRRADIRPAAIASATALATMLATALATALASTGCGDGEDVTAPNLSDVATVTIDPENPRVAVGTSLTLEATARDADGEELSGPTITLRWSVDRSEVATVDQNGVVQAVAPGSATVRVEAAAAGQDEPAVGSTTVEVLAIARVDIEPPSATLRVGETLTVQAMPRLASGDEVPGLPIRWSSANSQVAVVDVVDANPVTVRATGPGSTLIEAAVGAGPVLATGAIQVEVLSGSSQATGRVVDATNASPIATAVVDAPSGSVPTDAQGAFAVPVGPNDTTVEISVRATGYETVAVLRRIQPGNTNLGDVPLVPSTAVPGAISGVVRDARTGVGIAGASVSLARGIDDRLRDDPTLPGTSSDASGFYRLAGVPAGTYTVVGRIAEYQSNGATGIVVGNDLEVTQADVVLSPLGTGDIRIVLTWGEQPGDLDAHLTGPGFHVFFADHGSSTSPPFVGLDVDDRDGRGPETITIAQLDGTYRFSVHDFTNRGVTGSTALARSGAQVKVYTTQGLVRTYNVPNAAGNLWAVFTVSGDRRNPTITPLNTMSDVADPGAVPGPGWPGTTAGGRPRGVGK